MSRKSKPRTFDVTVEGVTFTVEIKDRKTTLNGVSGGPRLDTAARMLMGVIQDMSGNQENNVRR